MQFVNDWEAHWLQLKEQGQASLPSDQFLAEMEASQVAPGVKKGKPAKARRTQAGAGHPDPNHPTAQQKYTWPDGGISYYIPDQDSLFEDADQDTSQDPPETPSVSAQSPHQDLEGVCY